MPKKYVNGIYIEMTADEIAEMKRQSEEMPPAEPTAEERIAALEEMNEMLLECLLEMSEEVYA